MSTGLECNIICVDGKWYLGLEDDYIRNKMNYYGPFSSEDEAIDYLDYFPNPGGLTVEVLTDSYPYIDQIRSAVSKATPPRR